MFRRSSSATPGVSRTRWPPRWQLGAGALVLGVLLAVTGGDGAAAVRAILFATAPVAGSLALPLGGSGPGVAAVLARSPAPGQSVELDAYFSGAGGRTRLPGFSRPDCPEPWAMALTDRPFAGTLSILNGTQSNALPDDAPWLVAVPAARGDWTKWPFHGRFRGHLGDPRFGQCPHAERMFVVEAVVAAYSDQAPTPAGLWVGHADWPRHRDAQLGYSVAYPPGWAQAPQPDPGLLGAIALRAPQWPDWPVVVRVYAGETRYDPSLPASQPPLLAGRGMSPFTQRGLFPGEPEGARLQGYWVDGPLEPGARTTAVVFSGHGRSYQVWLRYPVGLEAAQPLLDSYASIVEGFRLDVPPEPTPVPVKQVLGPGPFLSQQEALAQASARASGPLDLVEARRVPEAEARRVPGPCRGFFGGHPDGVWLLTVREAAGDGAPTRLLMVDATTGEQLCSQPQITPPPLGRVSTATPVRWGR